MAQGVTVDFNANTAKFTEGVDKSIRSLDKFKSEAAAAGKALGAAFAAVTAATAYLVKQSIDSADAMSKMSQSTGIAIDKLSGLAYAGKLSGVEVEALGAAMVKLTKGMADASVGTGEALRGYEALGIKVKDASGNLKNADVVLGEVATKFAGMKDGANKTALAVAIFGKSGAAMVPMLNEGAAGLAEMHKEAERLGVILDKETGQAAVRFNDNLTALKTSASALGFSLAKDLLGPMTDITNAMRKAANDSGVLMAAWVGLGGVGAALFTDDLLSRTEQIQKRITALGGQIEMAEGMIGKITPFSAPLRAERQKLRIELEGIQRDIEEAAKKAKAKDGEKKPDAPMMKAADTLNKARKAHQAEADAMAKAAEEMQRSQIATESAEFLKREQEKLKQFEEFNRELTADALKAQAIIADTDPIYKAGLAWEELTALMEQGLLTADQAGQSYKKTFEDLDKSGNDAFKSLENAVRGWGNEFTDGMVKMMRTGKMSFSSLADSIINDLLRIQVQKNVTDPLIKAGTGWLDSFNFGGLFGGGKAIGGPVIGGTSYLVGERGPEIFTPRISGDITPNDKIGSAGSKVIVNQPITIDARGADAGIEQRIRAMMPVFIAENSRVVVGAVNQALVSRGQQPIRA